MADWEQLTWELRAIDASVPAANAWPLVREVAIVSEVWLGWQETTDTGSYLPVKMLARILE